ncbi:MAG TPA: GAF domain-containing protein, partial [candidate division Zixibacteria bacterium]|nr:GAF domain-containing protein [candidate division Zixibacteria bacterium]
MFSVILKVLLALTSLSLSIYLFQLKDRYPDLTKSGWNRVLAGVFLLFSFSLIEILDEFPQAKALIFGSPVIPLFLEVVFGILGLMLIIFGMVCWLAEVAFLKKKTEEKESEFLFLENLTSRTRKSSTLIETLENSLREVSGFLKVEASAIWIANPATGELVLASYKGLSPQLAKQFEGLTAENGIINQAARNKEILIQEEIPSTEEILMELKKGDFISLAAAPILAAEKNIGVLALFSKERYKLDSKLEKLLQNISSNLGEKIDSLRLAKEVKRRTDQLAQAIQENRILSVISGFLVSNLDLEQILDRIIWEGLKVIEAKVGHVVLVKDNKLEVKASLDPAFYGLNLDLAEFPLIREVLDRKKSVVDQSNLLVPILARNQILGMLWFENRESERVFSQAEVQQANALANQASLAVQNYSLKEELKNLHQRLTDFQERQKLSDTALPGPNFVNDMNNILAAIL